MSGKTIMLLSGGIVALCVMIDTGTLDSFIDLNNSTNFYSMLKYALVMPNLFLTIGAALKFSGPKILWVLIGVFGMIGSFVSFVVIPIMIYMYGDEQLSNEAPTILWAQLGLNMALTVLTNKLEALNET